MSYIPAESSSLVPHSKPEVVVLELDPGLHGPPSPPAWVMDTLNDMFSSCASTCSVPDCGASVGWQIDADGCTEWHFAVLIRENDVVRVLCSSCVFLFILDIL